MLDHIISVKEAAKLWNLSPDYIEVLCKEGSVLSKKVDDTWVIYRDQRIPTSQNQNYVQELDREIVWDLTPGWERREILDRNSRILGARLEMMHELKKGGVKEHTLRTKVFGDMTDEEYTRFQQYYNEEHT